MSATAPILPAADGGAADVPTDPASDRRRVINNDGGPDRRKVVHRGSQPNNGGENGPPPDRRKFIHQRPSAEGQEAAPPDRRKIIHREPNAGGGTGGSEDGPAPDSVGDRRRPIHRRPTAESALARRALADSLGGIPATDHEAAQAARMVRTERGPGLGARIAAGAQRVAATAMLFAMLGSAIGGALPIHFDGDGHAHETPVESTHHVNVQEANLISSLSVLYALAVNGWDMLTGNDICGDCGLDVDDGCKCVCYSGGYHPDDPACQF